MAASASNRDVFINCPFSRDYRPMFEAIVFAVADCGFKPRCALESDDGGEVRVQKIVRIIKECRFGVHDISFMALDEGTGLARLNMAFELGLFLGVRYSGRAVRSALILDDQPFRYRQAISDIAGLDIHAHGGEPANAITAVRNWLQAASQDDDMPGGDAIAARYQIFRKRLPALCAELHLSEAKLTFADLSKVAARWLTANA